MLIHLIKKLLIARLFPAKISLFFSRNAKVAPSENEYFNSKIAALAFNIFLWMDSYIKQISRHFDWRNIINSNISDFIEDI